MSFHKLTLYATVIIVISMPLYNEIYMHNGHAFGYLEGACIAIGTYFTAVLLVKLNMGWNRSLCVWVTKYVTLLCLSQFLPHHLSKTDMVHLLLLSECLVPLAAIAIIALTFFWERKDESKQNDHEADIKYVLSMDIFESASRSINQKLESIAVKGMSGTQVELHELSRRIQILNNVLRLTCTMPYAERNAYKTSIEKMYQGIDEAVDSLIAAEDVEKTEEIERSIKIYEKIK